MGLSGGQSKSSSGTRESTLSRRQAQILSQRESQYQKYFFPEMVNILNDVNQRNALASKPVRNANAAYERSLASFTNQAAQRGLTGSGFEAAGLAGLASARANAVTDAVTGAQQQDIANRMSLMQIAQGFAPTPTQSAQYHQYSKRSQWNATASKG